MTSRIKYNTPQGSDLCLAYHYEMVSDETRVVPFMIAIEKLAQGKRVLESGTGTGIMSLFAAKNGAEIVYAVEKDPAVGEVARQNIKRNQLDNIITILCPRDVLTVTIDDIGNKANMVIAENLSTWLAIEPQVPIMNYINKHLAEPDAIRLPKTVSNKMELACSPYSFYDDLVRIRETYFEFRGISKPEILSKPVLFRKVDLSKINDEHVDAEIVVEATQDGTVNGLRLTSPIVISSGIRFKKSDSLMPPIVVPLSEGDIYVRKGDLVKVHVIYDYGRTKENWSNFFCSAELSTD
ncbi:50S ribosomal protein L11 methyltransferase [Candidatus Woesearchaeota archaeon]|nr:50S ribosomal protein L11 methyltransferase [Candidatus Woesearchaeota archaeon]